MSRNPSQTGRNAGGRCAGCGISVADTEPRSLLRRAERLLHGAELVVERAAADDDFRLQLQAIDRVKGSLELLMKAVGLVGGDSSVTVNIVDERKQLLAFIDSMPPATLTAFQRGDCPHCGVSLADTPSDKPLTA